MAIGNVSENNSELLLRSSCTCPGYTLTYECRVMGERLGATVWEGSAFNCLSNEITLLHRQFLESARGQCNSGSIVGHSLRIDNGSYLVYTSQLNVTVSSDMIGKSIECFYDDQSGIKEVVGNLNITLSSGED